MTIHRITCSVIPLPQQLLLRCSASCIHAAIPLCHGATARTQGIRLKAPTLGEDPQVIHKILAYLDDNATSATSALLPDCRASPTVGLFVSNVCSNAVSDAIVYNLCIRMVWSLMHAKLNLPMKICVVCQRPFNWRRKWASCWEEVRYCSRRCRGMRRSRA